ISPNLRSNFDYVFLLEEDYISNMKRIYEHYAGMFPDFNTFRQVFMRLTEDYGAMVIKNRGKRHGTLEKIAFYKAPDLRKKSVSIGCQQFRDYHDQNYNKKWDEEIFQKDFDEFLF